MTFYDKTFEQRRLQILGNAPSGGPGATTGGITSGPKVLDSNFEARRKQILTATPKPTTKASATTIASPKVSTQPSLIDNVKKVATDITNTVKKIGKDIQVSFTPPKLPPPLPDSAFPTTTPSKQVQPTKPIQIKPDQTKLTPQQMNNTKGFQFENTTLSAAPKKTFWDTISEKVSELFDSTSSQKARAMNAMAVKQTPIGKNLDVVKLAEKGGNPLRNSLMEDVTKELGIRTIPTGSEAISGIFTVAAAVGLIEATVPTTLGLASFGAVNELKSGLISAVKGKGFKLGANESFSSLFENAPADVKNIIDIVDFLATAKVTHSLYKASPKAFEKLTKDIIVKTKGPETINFTPEQVKKVVIGTSTKYESDILAKLGLTSDQWAKASREGISVEVPTEKIVNLVDKPYWKKIKTLFGYEPTNITTVEKTPQKTRMGFKGYLTDGKEYTPQEIIGEVIKNKQETTPEGKELIKTATEAQKQGMNIKIDNIQNQSTTDITKKDIYHSGNRTMEQVKIEGLHYSRSPMKKLGEAVYFSDVQTSSEEYVGQLQAKLNAGDFNLKVFNSIPEETKFMELMGTDNISDAIRKEGKYDGFIITNNDPEVGNTFGITNLDKVNEKVTGKKITKPVEGSNKGGVNAPIEDLAIRKNSPQELAYDLVRKLNTFKLGDIKLSKEQKIELQQWDNKWGNVITSRGITAVKETPEWIKTAWNNSQKSKGVVKIQTTTLGKDTEVSRGAKDHAIDVTRPNGITGGVSFSTNDDISTRFAEKVGGTVEKSTIKGTAVVVDHSVLEKMVKDIPIKEKAAAVQKILKDNKIDVVRMDIQPGAKGEDELRVINPDVLVKKTITEKPQKVESQTFTGKQIAKEANDMGSDQGGLSDYTLNQIEKEDYRIETISIDELRKLDPDINEYIKGNGIRQFEGEPFGMNPIVSSKGEVIDGYNRIAQRISDGDKKIEILRGIIKEKKVKIKRIRVSSLEQMYKLATDYEKQLMVRGELPDRFDFSDHDEFHFGVDEAREMANFTTQKLAGEPKKSIEPVVKKEVQQPKKEIKLFKEDGKLNFDAKDGEMTAGQLKRYGFDIAAMGYGEFADVAYIGGKPILAYRWSDDGSIMGISVQEKYRRKGIVSQFLREMAENGIIRVQSPNKDMQNLMKKMGTVTGPDKEDTYTLDLNKKSEPKINKTTIKLDKLFPRGFDKEWDRPYVDAWKKKILAGEKIPPIVIDLHGKGSEMTGGVLDGHHRLQAYEELGITDIPYEVHILGKKYPSHLANEPEFNTKKTDSKVDSSIVEKPDWELTRKEYGEKKSKLVSGQTAGKTRKLAETYHASILRQAIQEGKTIPDNVLSDYPRDQYPSLYPQEKSVVKAKPQKITPSKLYKAIVGRVGRDTKFKYGVVKDGKMLIIKDGTYDSFILQTDTTLSDGQYSPVGNDMVKQKHLEADYENLTLEAKNDMGSISSDSLQNIVDKMASVVSKDISRSILMGTMFEITDGKLSFTATDGFRLYHEQIPTNLKSGEYILGDTVLLSKTLPALGEGQLKISGDDDRIVLKGPSGSIKLSKVNQDYPPYKRAIPQYTKRYEISKIELSKAIKELAPYLKTSNNILAVQFQGNNMELRARYKTESDENLIKSKTVAIKGTDVPDIQQEKEVRGTIIMPMRINQGEPMFTSDHIKLNYSFLEDTLKLLDGNKAYISIPGKGEDYKPIHISDRKEVSIEESMPPEKKKRAPSGIASSGAESLGKYESRATEGEKEAHETKIFKKVQELIDKYASTVGEGYTPRGALGVYFGKTQNIRINGMNDLSVASHEITHFLDYAFNISSRIMGKEGESITGNPIYSKLTRDIRKEITDLYIKYYPGGSPKHSLKKRTVEGFATLLQKYVEMPKQITAEFPNLVKDFLTEGGKYYEPVMGEIIKDLGDFIKEYQGLPALDKIGARVANQKLEVNKDSFFNIGDKVRTFLEDEVWNVEKVAKASGRWMTMRDPSLWLRAYKNAAGVYANNILNPHSGYWNLDSSGQFMKYHDFNWKTLTDHLKKEKIEDSFGNFLVARDQYYEWQELDKLKKLYDLAKETWEAATPEERTMVDEKGRTMEMMYKGALELYKEQLHYLQKNGFTRDEVDAAFNENKDRFALEAQQYDQLVRGDLDMLYNPLVGLVNSDQYAEYTSKQGYASMKRQMYDEILGEEGDRFVGAKSTKASSLKQRTGGQQQIINPVLNAMTNHIEITKKAMRQAVYNRLGEIAVSSQLPTLFQRVQLRAFPDDRGRIIFPQERDPNIIMARINGKRVPFIVDRQIKQTVDDVLTYQAMNLFEHVLVNVSRAFTIGTTGAYAPFALTNSVVDQWTAVMNTRNRYTPVIDQLKLLSNLIANKGGNAAKYFQEWEVLGGDRMTLFQAQMQTMEDAVKYITKEATGIEKALSLIDKGVDILSIPAKYSETMSRFTEYYKARMAGKNQLVALEEAGRVTAPFHHIGSWKIGNQPSAKYMVRSVPFGNAALQVIAQAARTAETAQGRKRILFLMLALAAAYLSTQYAINQLGSEDQKQQYKDLNVSDIGQFLHYPAMGGNGLIRIKVPTELSVLGTILAMVASDNVMGTKYSKEDYKDALTNWIPTQFNITDPVRMFFSWFSPAVKIPIELIANFKDYPRIKPLENQSMQNKEPKERYNEYTSPLAKLIGEKFNLSPIKIDFLIEGILGRASRYVTGKKGAYDVLSQGYRDYFFTIGRRVTNFYDDMDRNSQHWKTLSDKYKGVSNIPDEVKQDIKLTNRKRIAYNFVNDLLSEMRKIDEKKEPGKLKWYREKIIIGLEKISEIK